MFRISKDEEGLRTVIAVDGQLSGDAVGVLERYCQQESRSGRPLEVQLRDLTVIDEAGRALLSRLAAKGIQLHASGVYTSYVVEVLCSQRKTLAGKEAGKPVDRGGPQSTVKKTG